MIESDNYRDAQLNEYLKSLEYEEEEEELEKVVLADDGEIAEPYHCLGCGERLETDEIYGYCDHCKKMSPYSLPGIDFDKDLFLKSINAVGLKIDQLASRRRNINMLALKACIYFLKENGVHEKDLSVKFYRDRTNILHHNKVFGQLLAIGDKEAINLYNILKNE